MAKKKTYSEKLKDPRWQKKRLEVMNRANFQCEWCLDNSTTLHVHHGYYERGLEPWEYATETLWCLCENCHADAEERRRSLYEALARLEPHYFPDIEIAAHIRTPERRKLLSPGRVPTVGQILETIGGRIIEVEESAEPSA